MTILNPSTPRITVLPATRDRFTAMPITVKQKKRTAAYARVSTDSEEQQTSYEAQVSYYTAYIQNNPDWIFVDMYTDEGITGTNTKKRDGFNRMVADALDGKIDLIITKSVSRFARNTVDTLTTVRKLKAKGVEVYFEKENLYSLDPKTEVILTITSSLAQEESRSISENVTWGQRKRFADGKVSMSYKTFLGYRKGENGEPEIVPEEAEIVRRIYRLFLEGKTPYGIKKILEADAIPTPGGKTTWTTSTILSILTNEKYKGDALLQKTFCTDFITKKMKINEGEVPQYYVENSHPAIVTKEMHEQVQHELERRKATGKHHRGTSIFSGKLVCECCGEYYGSKIWHSNDKYRSIVWQCNLKYKGAKRCDTPNIHEKDLKQRFISAFNQFLANRDAIIEDSKLIQSILYDSAETEKIASAETELETIQELMKQCIAENATVVQDQSAYKLRYDELSLRYHHSIERLDELKEKAEAQNRRIAGIKRFVQSLDSSEVLDEFSQELWLALVEKVIVHRDKKLEFCFKNGSSVCV